MSLSNRFGLRQRGRFSLSHLLQHRGRFSLSHLQHREQFSLSHFSSSLRANRKVLSPTLNSKEYIIALAGNPNTGKSTLFNALTGLRQHTGNWPGKTVAQYSGSCNLNGKKVTLVDLPGIYSLLANTIEGEIARDFICFAQPDATVIVVDSTCLERNLNLALQILEITPKAILCANLIDEAKRKNMHIDTGELEEKLGIPVIPTAARSGKGLKKLKAAIDDLICGRITTRPCRLRYSAEIEKAISEMEIELAPIIKNGLSPRWVALQLLIGDSAFINRITNYLAGEQDGECPNEQISNVSRKTVCWNKNAGIGGKAVK